MRWTDLNLRPEARMLRQFALLWLLFFAGIGAFQWLARGNAGMGLTLAAIGGIAGLPGLIAPRSIRWLYVACMIVSFPIGWVVSQAMLAILFYVIITPMALLFRLRGRDLLLRRAAGQKSLWLPKSLPQDVRSYFRQY